MIIQSAAQARQLFALERRGEFPRGETRRLLHAQGGSHLLPEYVGTAPVLLSAPVTYSNHAPGMPHVRSTIAKMAKLARDGASSFPIVNLARRIVAGAGVPSKDYRGECLAIYKWVRDNIAYRKDPVHLEWLQSPERTVQERAGDCDDFTILIAALVGALGHAYHFDTVGPSKGVQKHVAAVADLDSGPLVLDPVLEPASSSTAARADVGTFGLRAHGAHILWNAEGRMLGFMGSVVNPRERKLWDWNPYYPPLGVGLKSGMQPAQGGVPTTPAAPYRLRNAPGFSYARRHPGGNTLNGPLVVLPNGQLGFSLIKVFKKVGKAVGTVVHTAGKIARSPIVQAGINVVAPGAGAAVAKAGEYEGRAETAIKQGPAGILRALPVPGVGKLATQIAASMIAKRDKGTAWQKPHPAIAKRYPKGATQVFDATHQTFRVYVPQSGHMSGIRPSLSFSLGAASSSSAQAAVSAVRAYASSHKNASPSVALTAVRSFQQQDTGRTGGLSVDGLWGPNTRKAAAWYLGVSESSLPPVAPPLSKTHTGAPVAITWAPPPKAAAPAAAPARLPPPAPPGTPSVPPAPIPGMIEVGHEANNPGLAPVAPSPAAAAAAPAAVAPAAAAAAGRTAAQKAATAAKKRAAAAPAAVKLTPVATAPAGRTAAQKAATAAKKRAAAAPAAVVVTPIDVTGEGAPAVPIPPAILTTGPGIPGGMTTAEYAQQAAPGAGRSDDEKLMWLAIGYLWLRQNKRRQAA